MTSGRNVKVNVVSVMIGLGQDIEGAERGDSSGLLVLDGQALRRCCGGRVGGNIVESRSSLELVASAQSSERLLGCQIE